MIERGLQVNDPQTLVDYLKQVNYYRLSGYTYAFKETDPVTGIEQFKPGTTFEMIRDRYEFDRRLRLLFMDSIERIEVAILRTRMVELHARTYGPFGYTDYKNYNPKFPKDQFKKLMDDIHEDENRSYEEFIHRYRNKYTSEENLPLWMVTDLMPFGQLLTMYRNLHLPLKQKIAHELNIFPPVLDSWLLTLNYIRNCCAHHSRLWNRPLAVTPKLPDRRYDPRWYAPIMVDSRRIYAGVLIVRYLMQQLVPQDRWKESFEKLLSDNPSVPLKPMGFPKNWVDCPIWR